MAASLRSPPPGSTIPVVSTNSNRGFFQGDVKSSGCQFEFVVQVPSVYPKLPKAESCCTNDLQIPTSSILNLENFHPHHHHSIHHASNNMTPTHYTILSLPPSLPPSTHPSYQTTVKRAYHRTLLRCHPDKLPTGVSAVKTTAHHDGEDNPTEIYTIDQINTAYKTLSNPSLRHAYDASLRQLQSQSSQQKVDAYRAGGLDVIDLDDMVFRDDEGVAGATGGRYTRSCRCGAEEGYVLTEDEMDEVEAEVQRQRAANPTAPATTTRGRSMIVGCLGCSLYVQVDWAVCDDDDDDE
ncbi:Diphthamide biosynthesis protein 4 [Drechslerella dactyloides]|uniref:Diphthamide biosynthesis protein 4 n=1 Tax=Drechslerella dactyloides TaxID=74499 RepID=A0AAD6J119_DREDA|nr:Diphthamide biosynthesis protein 4 [Drechslerella dactyloides]